MPHPEQEHALMIEVATLTRQRDDMERIGNAKIAKWQTRAEKAESALAAARRECEGLRASLNHIAQWNDEQLAMLESEEAEEWKDGDRTGYYACWTNAHKIAAADARKALAAPAAGEEGKR